MMSFDRIIHEYILTVKMTIAVDKDVNIKNLLFELLSNDYALIFKKIITLTRLLVSEK